MGEWTFFSNHGHVLVCLARDREARLRDVAIQVGITERAVQKIVKDMQDAGYLEISKHGRRNRYRINNRKSLRHPLQSGCTVGQLIQLLNKQASSTPAVKNVAEIQAAQKVIPEEKPGESPRESSPAPGTVQSETPKPEPSRPRAPETEKPTREPSKSDLEQGRLF